MSNCIGDGQCLKQCSCECFDEIDETTDRWHEICTCGHREHNGYCPSDCIHNCQLKECHNYWYCKEKRPQWVLSCHNSCCVYCAVEYGKMKQTNVEDECPICMETKKLITVTCGKHNTCLDCWKKIAEKNPAACPLCRKKIWS